MTTGQDTVTTEKKALYVYCVARGKGNCVLGPIGLDGRRVYTVASGDTHAVVHNCQPEPYQSDDRQVAEGWIFAHQNVVQAAGEVFGTVLPMSFNMIVQNSPESSEVENLHNWLEEKQDKFIRLLDKLTGKAEYAVHIFWDYKSLAEAAIKSNPEFSKIHAEAKNKPKGLTYMLEQKLAKVTRAAVERQANRHVEDFYGRIRQCVQEVHVDPVKKSNDGKQILLNLSCLMDKSSTALGTVLDEIQKTDGISVRFTGPWPPYSFVGSG